MLQFSRLLWITGSLPFILLGTMHLLYTFFTNKFSARNAEVDAMMKTNFPVLTNKTSIWKAWIGFNGSHSSGAMYIGLINFIVAVWYVDLLQKPAFLILNILTAFFYLWLAKKYWFSTPLRGILISWCCFVAAALLIILQSFDFL